MYVFSRPAPQSRAAVAQRFSFVVALFLASAASLSAQTFTSLHSFTATEGSNPYAGLIQATSGALLGVTSGDGAHGGGSIYQINASGTLTTLYSFCALASCADGTDARGTLLQATNGNFYGTTFGGGPFSRPGTIFRITPKGVLTTLYTFCTLSGCADGEAPFGGMTQAMNGNLYGTTSAEGTHSNGTVFSLKPSGGVLTTLYDFCSLSSCADGESSEGSLVQGLDGKIYGTAFGGGAFTFYGTVFDITQAGVFTTLHSFDGTDGSEPIGGVFQADDGNFYGTTQTDGSFGFGTVFRINSSGAFKTLYNFCMVSGCPDGSFPQGTLVQGSDGKLYGTTLSGGASGVGTIFSITTAGTLTTLHSFDGAGGSQPWAGVVQDTNGKFYGTTFSGGPSNLGTIYNLAVGLGLFLKTQPTAGKAGAVIAIFGTNLKSATKVTIGGTSVPFTQVSNTEVTATVPAVSGKVLIQVTAASGTLSAYPKFVVLK